jgi:hypothetical protein
MAAKLGLMVACYDMFDDTSNKDLSLGAIVCTINNSLTKYISYTVQTSSLRVYHELTNNYQSRII